MRLPAVRSEKKRTPASQNSTSKGSACWESDFAAGAPLIIGCAGWLRIVLSTKTTTGVAAASVARIADCELSSRTKVIATEANMATSVRTQRCSGPKRGGRASSRSKQSQPTRNPAKQSEAATNRGCAAFPERRYSASWSFLLPFELVEHTAKLFELFLGAVATGKCVHHQFAGRALKHALQHIRGELLLGLFRRLTGFIDVGALVLCPGDEAFGGHDLHKLKDARIADLFGASQGVVHLADRGRAASPENLKDFQLRRGRVLCCSFHEREATTKDFVLSTKIFVV